MDEVRVWDYARTQGEIQGAMSSTLAGNETGLIVYYKLDELTGTTITDASFSGNDGIAGGFGGDEWGPSGAFADVSAPQIVSGPTTSNIDDNGWDFTLQLDEIGDVHWAVYTQAQPGGITNSDVQGVIGDGAVGGGALSVPTANSDRTQVINGWVI